YLSDALTDTCLAAKYGTHVIIWAPAPTQLADVPYFDIHSYTQGLDGLIYFNSGMLDDANSNCIGLEGIVGGATADSSYGFDYTEVLLGGTTSAYRTTTEFASQSENKYGYFVDKQIGTVTPYDSKDAYFLTGKESAVIVADPVVNIKDESLGESYIYRFKEWLVYSRYNSEILYYNRGMTESLLDRYDAILRFAATEAGYYVILPVYERVYTLSLGSEVENGAANIGGSVSVNYGGGEAVDISGAQNQTPLYFTQFHETTENDKTGYFYDNITTSGFLFFTGVFTTEGHPVFKTQQELKAENKQIVALRETKLVSTGFLEFKEVDYFNYYLLTLDSNGKVTEKTQLPTLTEKLKIGEAGIVELVQKEGANGTYWLTVYNTLNVEKDHEGNIVFDGNGNPKGTENTPVAKSATHGYDIDGVLLSDLLFLSHITAYYYDGIASDVQIYDQDKLNLIEAIETWLFHDQENISVLTRVNAHGETEFYAVFEDKYAKILDTDASSSFDKLLLTYGKHFATSFTNDFAPIRVIKNNPYVGGSRVNTSGSLASGELAYEMITDENGNLTQALSPTLNYKTSYYDRDTTITLTASPDEGYVLDGWKIGVYDNQTNRFVLKDESYAEEFEYTDLIIAASYNQTRGTYYYITEYFTVQNDEKVYFMDEEKTVQATVPATMLNSVRGTFVNDGTLDNPNYVQVHLRGTDGKYYYDQSFTKPVSDYAPFKDEQGNDVLREFVEMPFVDAVRSTYRESDANGNLIDSENGIYYLSNQLIFFHEGNFYRSRSNGNITITGNTVEIKRFHSNMRFVAVFKELYNTYIFAEPDTESGVRVIGAYYYNTDASTHGSDIRYDYTGTVRTTLEGAKDFVLTGTNVFAQGTNYSLIANAKKDNDGKMSTDLTTRLDSIYTSTFTSADGTLDKYTIRSNEVHALFGGGNGNTALPGVGDNTPLYRISDGLRGDDLKDLALSLEDYYFAEDTVMYFVVSVESSFDLNIHSLGADPKWVLSPILAPTKEYVKFNQENPDDSSSGSDYLFYVFKMTYNRDLTEENASLLNQSNRGVSLVSDLLSGRENDFYNNYFDLYDNFGNKLVQSTDVQDNDWKVSFAKNKETYTLSKSYVEKILKTLTNENGIRIFTDARASELANEFAGTVAEGEQNYQTKNPSNSLRNAFEVLCDFVYMPKAAFVSGVKYSPAYQTYIKDHAEGVADSKKFFSKALPGYYGEITNEDGTITKTEFPLIQAYFDIFDALTWLSREKTGSEIDPDNPSDLETPLFDHGGPWFAGSNNFINLSSIIVYTFSVETVTLDGYDTDGNPITNTNAYHNLLGKFYTAQGINDTRYIGSGEERDLNADAFTYPNEYSGTTFTQYVDTGIDPSERHIHPTVITSDKYKFQNTLTAIRYEDFLLAENSLMLLEGAEDAKDGYAFVGWFEQKFEEKPIARDENGDLEIDANGNYIYAEEGAWGEFSLVSTSLKRPYVAISNADTKIVALYKRVVDVSYTYDPTEVAVSLSVAKDDLGRDLSYTAVYSNGSETRITDPSEVFDAKIRVQGSFFFDSNVTVTVAPVGGFRLDTIDYSIFNENVLVGSSDFLENYTLPDADDIKLGKVFNTPSITRTAPINGVDGLSFMISQKDPDGNPVRDQNQKLITTQSYNKTATQNISFNLFDHLTFADKNDVSELAKTTEDINNDSEITYDDYCSNLLDIDFEIKAKAVKIVYVEVGNYNHETNQNFAFALIGADVDANQNPIQNTAKVYATITPKDVDLGHTLALDDAAHMAVSNYDLSTDTATFAIYIDADTLASKAFFVSTLKKSSVIGTEADTQAASVWYINGYATETTTIPAFANGADLHTDAHLFDAELSFDAYSSFDLFKISFAYDGDYEYLNNADFFDLSQNNSIYYLFGRIVENFTITVSHAFVNNVADLDEVDHDGGKLHIMNNASSTVIYRGAYYESGNISGNGYMLVTGQKSMLFSSDTLFDLTVSSLFEVVDGKLYMFVGWFEIVTNAGESKSVYSISLDGKKITENGSALNQNQSISSLEATSSGSVFEARYVLVNKLDLVPQTHGEIVADASNTVVLGNISTNDETGEIFGDLSYSFTALSNYNGDNLDLDGRTIVSGERLVMNGANVKLHATPADGYIFSAFKIGDFNDEHMTHPDAEIPYFDEAITKVDGTYSYILTVGGTGIEVDDTKAVAVFEQGIKINVEQQLFDTYQSALESTTTGTKYTTETYVYISYEHNGENYAQHGFMTSATVASNSMFKIEFILPDDNQNFTFVGFFVDGTLVSFDEASQIFENYYEDIITRDLMIEARFVRNAKVNVLANDGNNSILNNAAFEISYTDFKTGQTVSGEFASNTFDRHLPSGTVLSINDVTNFGSNSFNVFTEFKQDTLSISKNKHIQSTVVATSQNKTINYISSYAKGLKVNLSKIVNLHNFDEDKQSSNIFDSYFDMSVTYMDIHGKTVTQNFGSRDEFTVVVNVNSSAPKTLQIKVSISDAVKERYTLRDVTYDYVLGSDETDSHEHTFNVTLDGTNLKNNHTLTVIFDPINSVVVSRVVNDKEFSGSENPNVTDGTNTIESDNSSMIIVVADKAQITLTAEAGASHIEFVGWFVDGTLKGTDTTLTLSEIKTSSRVVAKFNSLATLTISRKINDEEIGNADINLPLYFAGNIKNDSGAISLGSFKLENAKSTETISVVSGTEGFAVATHLAGYEFVGWTLSVGTTTTELSPVGGTGLEMTSKIEGLTAGASYTLTALYETQNTVNYVSTVLGQTEGDTLPSISGNAFYSSSDSSLALTTTPADGYALRKVIVTYFDSDGTKHSFINPTLDTVSLSDEIKGHNIVVEGVFGKQMFITVRVAVEESNDKLALESFGITDSNRANITAFSQNGTAYTFQDILNPYTETYMINLDGVFAGDIVSLSASDFKIGILKDYYFNGYYVFDSENLSIPSSVSAYSYDDSYSFVANQNMQIVLKYDQNQTSYANTTTITGVALTVDGTINLGSQTNGGFGGLTQDEQNPDIFHFGTKTLVFLGYVQEIKNNLRPSTFVLVSDNHAQDISQCGLTSAVAVFAEAQTVSVNAEIAGANSFSLVSSIKASSKGLTPVLNSNGKITTFFRLIEIEDSRFAFLGSNSKAKLTFTAKTHYAYYDESGNDINSCTVDLDELTTALSDHRQTVKVTVKAQNDRVTDVTAQISSAPQIQTLSIEIIEEDSNIVVDGGTQTVQIVLDTNRANGQNFTVTVDGTTHTFPATLTVKNNATLWLKIEEITNVSSQIFKGYTLLAEDGTEIITVSDKLAELYLSNLDLSGKGTLTLKAVFDAKFTLSVSDDSNFENGTITATNIGENILDITANPNSYIKDILVKNADGRFTSIWQNNTVVVDGTYISSSSQKYSSNTGMSGKTLFTKLTLGLTLLQNTTVKVVLQEYFTLNVEHWIDSSLKTVLGYYITDQTSFNFDLLKNTTSSSIDTNDESFVGFFFEGTMLARNNSNSFNFERSTIVQAKFVTKLDISIETKTNGELGSSVAGINVVKNTNTANPLITGVGTATAEDISINGQTFLHAFDNGYVSQGSKNSFYEFAGWFINDGTEDVCISENAVLVINQTFANAIKHTIQDGNGNDVTAYHTVVAVFNEITRTTIVETDYGSDENDIKFNVQGIDATTTKTLVDQTDYKISVQLVMPEDADQYVLEITYPIAATFVNESTDTFTVTASNFTQKDIPSGIDELGNTIYTTYYDYYDESDAQYYRFKNYKTNEGIISNYDEYDRAVILNFSSSNRTITASAAKLYTIELMTNFAHDLIDLRISTINTETGEKVTVASITNITTSLKPQEDGSIDSIKSFMFEAGQTVQVEVDYLEYAKQHGTSSTYHPFNTLAYSVDPNNELVKVFTDFYNDETIDPKYSLNSAPLNTKEFWMETFEGMQPVSQIDAFTQTSGTQTENLSTYNFAVTNNTYFIADFLDAFGDLRYYINAAISTVAPNSNFTPSTGSDTDIIKQEDAVNHHFNFGFVLTKTENEVTHTKGNYSDSPEIGDDSSYIIHVFDPQEDDDENFENDSFSVTSTNGQNSYHVSERMYTKINLQVGIVNKDTTKLSSLWSYPSDADFLKTAFGAPITKGNDPIYVNSTAGAAAYYKFGDQVKIVAQDITSLGYFFKGFIVLQSTRQNQILASHDTRANDVQTKTLTTYANIPYETSEINGISYNVATFKAEGNMNVVALYEPKTFVVEVKVLEYDLNAQEGQRLTDKASHSGKVRGSLIAEQGKPLALSAMNYNFAQFYGWTSNIEIGAYFASGDLIHESNYATSTNLEEYYDAFKHPENFPSAVYEMLDRSTAEKITLIHEIIERYDEVAETYLPLHQKLEELYGKGLVLQNKINDFVLYYQKTLKFDDRVYKDDANPDESQLSPTLDASPMTTSLNRLSLYAFNNIYMPTITDGLVLSAYYAPLQYTVQINITEVMTGFNYDAADGVGATDAYITYSDAYVEKYKSEHGGVWENPSYGYNGVEKDSIYVYTVYDNTGKIIA
ncbi:MAG: hypothetical protein IJW24_03655, partial [Clostridia bacterium]|nr:hypothetical protein [Clostridia bacterium]